MSAQLKTKAKSHQICLVHLLINCNELKEFYSSIWAGKLKKILSRIIALKKEEYIDESSIEKKEGQLNQLLNDPLTKSHRKVKTLQKQLKKHQSYITTCLYHRKVPPDNNQSEQGLRNIKIKQKVSTGFRTMKDAQVYAIIRSIVDTAIIQGIHPLEAIQKPQLLFNSGE